MNTGRQQKEPGKDVRSPENWMIRTGQDKTTTKTTDKQKSMWPPTSKLQRPRKARHNEAFKLQNQYLSTLHVTAGNTFPYFHNILYERHCNLEMRA